MNPTTAAVILAAWRNEKRPPCTIGARVRDALAHVRQSHIKKPAKQLACDGLGIRDENISTPDPHL